MKNRILKYVKRIDRQTVERAIANATVTGTANFSSFSNGIQASPIFRKIAYAADPFLFLAERMIVLQGYTQGRAAALAEYANAGAFAENDVVVPTALGTITTSSSTLGQAAIGIAYTSQALNTLDDEANFLQTTHEMAIHSVQEKMADDLDALAVGAGTTLTARAGLKANWAELKRAVRTVRASKGARAKCVARVPEKVKDELLDDLRLTGATYLAGAAAQEYVARWGLGAPVDGESLAFVYDDVAIYVANLAANVLTADAGVNYLNLVFVPTISKQDGNGGTNDVIPAYALFGREIPSKRQDAEMVADIDGIGIMRYPVPVGENAMEWVYVSDYDAVTIDADASCAFKSGVTA